MDSRRELSPALACSLTQKQDDGLSGLDILSSVAKVDSLKDISSLEELSQNEPSVIELLNHYSKLSGDTPATAQAARDVVVACRQSQIHTRAGKSETQGPGFDRLIYLLDRYLDYCGSIKLAAFPIDHLKISLWLKNDVTLTTNSTRLKPLKKTVRCYVTSLESIRVKTLHLFKGIHLPVHLMKSKIILEILNGLSVERDNLEERLGGNHCPAQQSLGAGESQSGRDLLLNEIRSRSGDEWGQQAMEIVKASRGGEQSESGGKARGKAADPHIHTLLRYRNYCFLNKIPMWPIDSPRVALWLKESVLVGDPRNKSKKSTVSFRTVQVYLSRLEYARHKTEHLFSAFANHGGSLYKATEIVEILNDLNNPKKAQVAVKENEEDDSTQSAIPSSEGYAPVSRSSSQGTEESPATEDPAVTEDPPIFSVLPKRTGLPSRLPSLPSSHPSQSKKRKLSTARNFSSRKAFKMDIENSSALKMSNNEREIRAEPRVALRDTNGRRTASFRVEAGRQILSRLANANPVAPASPTGGSLSFPSISEWFSPPPSPAKGNKGCISFILCSDEESERSYTTATTSYEISTPHRTPTRHAASKGLPMTPSRLLDSPSCHRFWTNPLSGLNPYK
ncbi:hypothetical protein PTTG_06904 [Puccinia triticina 1-1 BBBD Race 1]|uniref:Uncharacterized protein n=2 Tax=Puccinia triticina TaxID=208348 RepID=A0A180G963_PUCT1|nr:uncharacterized protein PtA15_13A393 [Puccinia triticina]OAV89164.1 hypothetical protein PTTG_06904 [Puccinia triticina 1-1 BBBD Race 1]WAQ90993.1 hypothetical protein PtA15_13A393 [Puccinia triticina]WAR61182.1 hypothetical protein PtB15_13B434 [Puccinia triticina]